MHRSRVLFACLLCTYFAGAGAQTVPRPQYLEPAQLTPDQLLFNPSSGFYTSVAQRVPGPRNPPCPGCALDLNFQPLNPAYNNLAPLSGTPANEYGRLSWHSLEAQEGKYDFSIIDNVLQPCPAAPGALLCLPDGVKFGFRIMALNPQYNLDTNVTTGADGFPVYSNVPSYLESDGQGKSHGWLLPISPSNATLGHYFVPDWNDSYVLARVWALLAPLGERYDADPRIGNIDIGLYGSWGEWHTAGLPDTQDYKYGAIPYTSTNSYYNINTQAYLANTGVAGAYAAGSAASKESIVWAHVRAFPDKQLVMLTDDGDGVCAAMGANTKRPVGLRRDSLGSYNGWNSHFPSDPTSSCTTPADQTMIADRWRKAPFLVEPFGNGSSPTFPCQTFETDPATGELEINEQVLQFHLAGVKNGAYCAGIWEALTPTEQAAVLLAGLQSGYRYSLKEVYIPGFAMTPAGPAMTVHAHWTNGGVTPAYDPWQVEFSLWHCEGLNHPSQEVAAFVSTVDLRTVLPTALYVQPDVFPLPRAVTPGYYELRVRVIDPAGYMKPMQLALQDDLAGGYYQLGYVQVPDLGH